MFQMTFAIITAALITGAVADLVKFSGLCLFIVLWSVLVYSPIAHAVWHPNGLIFGRGASPTTRHSSACGARCGAHQRRHRWPRLRPRDRQAYRLLAARTWHLYSSGALAVIGASLLWVGWMGFNAGFFLGTDGGWAIRHGDAGDDGRHLRRHPRAWVFVEWMAKGKPSVLGAISGAAAAGLVAITPAAGWVFPGCGAWLIGAISGIVCFWAVTSAQEGDGL